MPVIVNSEKIEDEVIQNERSHLRRRFAHLYETGDTQKTEEWIRNLAHHNVISRTLLQQEAWRDPEPVDAAAIAHELERRSPSNGNLPRPQADGQTAEARVRLSRLLARITKDVARPTRKEIDLYYKTNRSGFVAPERIQVRQIIKNVDGLTDRDTALAAIQAAKTELEEGSDFAAVADRHSDCPGNGGDLGWFARGTMVEEFDQIVFGLEPGELSPVFETRFGFHIAQVLDRKPEGPQPLSEVRDRIAAGLHEERRSKVIAHFVDELTSRASIQIERGAKS